MSCKNDGGKLFFCSTLKMAHLHSNFDKENVKNTGDELFIPELSGNEKIVRLVLFFNKKMKQLLFLNQLRKCCIKEVQTLSSSFLNN